MRGTLFFFFLPCGAMQCCMLSRDVAKLVPRLRGQEASQRVIDHLTSLGLETRADLATYYIVPPLDAELAQLWRCARDEPFLDVAAAVEVSRTQMHNQAKTKTNTVATNHGRLTFRRPFCRGVSRAAAAQGFHGPSKKWTCRNGQLRRHLWTFPGRGPRKRVLRPGCQLS